jgi:hypothetical protein
VPTGAATSRASTTSACGGWATTGTRRAFAPHGSPRPGSSTSCSTRGRRAAGASTSFATASTLEEIEQRLDGWREVVGDWGSLRWLLKRLGSDVPPHVRRAAGLLAEGPESRFARPVASDVA